MGCNDKLDMRCDSFINSRCTRYEGSLSANSGLLEEGCISLHDTTEDLYSIVEHLDTMFNPNLSQSCLVYPLNPSIAQTIEVLDKAICDLKGTELESILYQPIIGIIDTGCLQGECESQITTVKDLLQALVNKVCVD